MEGEQQHQEKLYDEGLDEADAEWLDRSLSELGVERSPTSLSCPCCFNALSFHCQPHIRFKGQFRAIFVRGCRVEFGNVRTVDGETFYEVYCSNCGTGVGVCDHDEVYHFHNILASNA